MEKKFIGLIGVGYWGKKLLRNLLVILISLAAIILIIDTFKQYFSIYMPGIVTLLDNLYATLYDLKLFLKDLFN